MDIGEALERQNGLILRRQALETISVGKLKHLLATRWTVVLPGVYAGFTGEISPRQRRRGAALYGGDSAQFADVTALFDQGIRNVPSDWRLHLLIPATEHRASKGFVTVRRTHRLPPPRVVNGFPYCPPERALVEAAKRLCDLRMARATMSDAVQRRIACAERLTAELPHLSGRGAGIARRAIEDVVGGGRSAPECEFIDLARRHPDLPLPLLNPLIRLPDGRKVSPDALFVDAGLVHETNGREFHAEEDLFESMQARTDAMTTADLVVLNNSPRQLRTEGDRVMSEVLTCYRRHAGRGLPPGVVLLRPGPPGTPHVT
jgi:hypothetical protein